MKRPDCGRFFFSMYVLAYYDVKMGAGNQSGTRFLLFWLILAYGLKPRLLILSNNPLTVELIVMLIICLLFHLLLLEWDTDFLQRLWRSTNTSWSMVIIGLLAPVAGVFTGKQRNLSQKVSIGPFSVYVMTDFRVNEIASLFPWYLYNFKNLLYLLQVGRISVVLTMWSCRFGFFGITPEYWSFWEFLLVIRLILGPYRRDRQHIITYGWYSFNWPAHCCWTFGYRRGNDPDQRDSYSSCFVRRH